MDTVADNRSEKAKEKEKENATRNPHLIERAKGIAAELTKRFRPFLVAQNEPVQTENARACASIACDEIMSVEFKWSATYNLYSEVKKQLQ